MKLLNELMTDFLKHDVKTNRAQRLKKIVKQKSKSANPSTKGAVWNPRTDIVASPEEHGRFSGMF